MSLLSLVAPVLCAGLFVFGLFSFFLFKGHTLGVKYEDRKSCAGTSARMSTMTAQSMCMVHCAAAAAEAAAAEAAVQEFNPSRHAEKIQLRGTTRRENDTTASLVNVKPPHPFLFSPASSQLLSFGYDLLVKGSKKKKKKKLGFIEHERDPGTVKERPASQVSAVRKCHLT